MRVVQSAVAPLFTAEDAATWAKDIQDGGIDAPYVRATVSTLGGRDRPTIMLTVSADPKEKWTNGILENSRYGKFSLSMDGTIELFSGHGLGKFRKHKVKNFVQLFKEFDTLLESLKPKQADKSFYLQLDKQADEEKSSGKLAPDLYYEISALIDNGRINADDTCFKEQALPEGEWASCFLSSLGVLLSDHTDPKVADWFRSHGVQW